ncbi:esterase/lipase family protein [Nitrosospira sp. Is2]|uniref:esterase/lipase family protein n=1 Tax=Nitrosospira sp. Is2 TaxID=3080532 RepID=UPI0029530B2F|nr:alpha/beta fold hydrolase [Nitrosospira sp. Is2]WON74797.1 alpha/beta fold hydrolase [Nitrosospira sp. Is2]
MSISVIFVHGLGGGASTWGSFPQLITEDTDLDVNVDFMVYPSPFLGIKWNIFQRDFQSIEDLAKTLRTLIENKHGDADEIVLVGHSLGGLIIRKYLLEERIAGNKPRAGKVILYAVPNNGAPLALIGRAISIHKNLHLWQLRENSGFVKQLNESWARSRIEDDVEMTVVVAGNDKVVSIDSAEGPFKRLPPLQISGVGHLDVAKPRCSSDMSFHILKNAILKKKYLPKFQPQIQIGSDFTGWQKYSDLFKFKFCLDENRQRVFDSLLTELTKVRLFLRIKGLSGLGKTRLIYEAILASPQEIKDKVLYVNAADESSGLRNWLRRAIDRGYKGILIVDNCKPELHKDLSEEVARTDSNVLLITLDHSLDRSSASTHEYLIGPLDLIHIKALLQPEYGNSIPDLDRVAAFAQGFPQMAVLIAKARLLNDPEVGKLTDDQLAERLLGDINQTEQAILRGCSLFDRFGCEEAVSDQYKYLATKVVKVTAPEFYKCIKKFQQKGLVDISGRYAQLVPKPLAVRLASEWWNQTHREEQVSFLQEIPANLVEPFCLQVTMLSFIPEVKELTLTLCGPQGPFGQAEAILSTRGSRLLRSFVEVDPIATSSALFRILNSLSHEELTNISGDVRRNLVWALEKLVFHARVFEEAAWSLMLLASAENESWSNNATGIFSHLFGIHLPGTEADFALRLRFLQRAIELNDSDVDKVVIKALNASVETHGGRRAIGAEYQGTSAPLKEWHPRLWQEIFDYWDATFAILVKFVERRNENSQEAQEIIGRSIRRMIRHGRIEMLDRAITRLVELNGRYWPSALDSIKSIFEHDTKDLQQEGMHALSDWLGLLAPDEKNLSERLKIVVVNPPREYREDERGDYIDLAALNAEQLATELSKHINQVAEYIPLLISGEQKQTLVFGKRLATESEDAEFLLQLTMAELGRVENANELFAMGLLSGLYVRSINRWNAVLEQFSTEKHLIKYYPNALRSGEMQSTHLLKLLDLIRDGQLKSNSASILSYGKATSHLSSKDISTFCLELAEIDARGAWTALGILFMHCFTDDNTFSENRLTLRKLVTKTPLNNNEFIGGHMDIYHWVEVTKKLLATEGRPFCEDVCRHIIAASNDQLDYGDISNSIKPLLIDIMKAYGEAVWPIFGAAIVSAKPIQLFWLQELLERDGARSAAQPSVFALLPSDFVIEWCTQNLKIAPFFVARTIDVFDEGPDGVKQPTALFIALLENFGGLERFRSELSANLGTGTWCGSLVPYLQSDKNALSPLLHHAHENVRSWVREYIAYLDSAIKHESMMDDEDRLGVR